MIPRARLEDITEADLQRLIDHSARECRTLDFKRDLDLSRDAKQELAEDVCAFANSVGGDLVIGIEAFDKSEGDSAVAKAVVPIRVPNLDAALLELQSSLRDSLEPQLATLHAHPIPLGAGGHVVVLRIGASPNAPHRVVRRGGGHFYLRNSVGKEAMDIHAIRTAFAFADTVAERALAWREQRLTAIRANRGPRPLRGGPRFVVQMLPLRALTQRNAYPSAFLKAAGEQLLASRPCGRILNAVDVNYEGVVASEHTPDPDLPALSAYAQVFRDGSLELVGVVDPQAPGNQSREEVILPAQYEVALVQFGLPAMQRALAVLETPAPAYLFVALLDVWHRRIGFQRPDSLWREHPLIPSHLNELLSAPLLVEDLVGSLRAAAREALAPLWHAVGVERSQTQIEGSLL